MALSTVLAQIADDLERTDLTSQIASAVKAAVYHHENERFWFNELYHSSLTLSASAFSITQPILQLDRVRLKLSSNNQIELWPYPYDKVMMLQENVLYADPQFYCLYAETVQFDCAPTSNKTIIVDGVQRISSASAASDATTWFTDPTMIDLVRSRAKFSLYAHIIKDSDQATACLSLEADALRRAREKTNRRRATGRIQPTWF